MACNRRPRSPHQPRLLNASRFAAATVVWLAAMLSGRALGQPGDGGLSCSITTLSPMAAPGEFVTFDLIVRNNSATPIDQVTISDNPTPATCLANFDTDDPRCTGTTRLTCVLDAPLSPGASTSIRFFYRVSGDPNNCGAGGSFGFTDTINVAGMSGNTPVASSCATAVTVIRPTVLVQIRACIPCDANDLLPDRDPNDSEQDPCLTECPNSSTDVGLVPFTAIQAAPGQAVNFSVAVTNTSTTQTLSDVMVMDNVDAGFVMVTPPIASTRPPCNAMGTITQSGSTINASVPSLAPGQCFRFRYQAVVAESSFQSIDQVLLFTTAIVSQSSKPNLVIGRDTQITEVVFPRLSITKLVSLDGTNFVRDLDIQVGTATHLFWRITIQNTGRSKLANVIIQDVFPSPFENLRIRPPGNSFCSVSGNLFSCGPADVFPDTAVRIVDLETDIRPGFSGNVRNIVDGSAVAGSRLNPGIAVTSSANSGIDVFDLSAIPTLGAWAMAALVALLGTILVVYRRVR